MQYLLKGTYFPYEEEDTCVAYEEEDTCVSHEEEDTRVSYEEEDTRVSYEEEDTCAVPTERYLFSHNTYNLLTHNTFNLNPTHNTFNLNLGRIIPKKVTSYNTYNVLRCRGPRPAELEVLGENGEVEEYVCQQCFEKPQRMGWMLYPPPWWDEKAGPKMGGGGGEEQHMDSDVERDVAAC